MSISRLISNSRPFFTITLLACALTVTACLDESCGITSPSEATGSHEETSSNSQGGKLLVLVNYVDEGPGADRFTISSSQGGSLTVERNKRGLFVVDNMKVGSSVKFFRATDPTLAVTCTWTGQSHILIDVALHIVASRRGNGGPGGLGELAYELVCSNW